MLAVGCDVQLGDVGGSGLWRYWCGEKREFWYRTGWRLMPPTRSAVSARGLALKEGCKMLFFQSSEVGIPKALLVN